MPKKPGKSARSAPPIPDPSPKQIEIVEAFLTFCYRKGVEAVTQQEIAKASGLALATVQYYFGKGKPDLSAVALRHVARVGQEFTSQGLLKAADHPDYRPIHAYLQVTFAWAKALPTHASYWLYSHYRASIQSDYQQLHSEFLSSARKRIESMIYEEYGRRSVAPPKNVADLAVAIHAALMGALTSGVIELAAGALDFQLKRLLWTVDALMPELRPSPAQTNAREKPKRRG